MTQLPGRYARRFFMKASRKTLQYSLTVAYPAWQVAVGNAPSHDSVASAVLERSGRHDFTFNSPYFQNRLLRLRVFLMGFRVTYSASEDLTRVEIHFARLPWLLIASPPHHDSGRSGST